MTQATIDKAELQSFVQEVRDVAAEQYAETEAVVRAAYADGRDLSQVELRFVQSKLNIGDAKKLQKELSRMRSAFGRQRVAGTSKDRKALAKVAKATAAKRDTEEPKLREQIAALEAQLSRLQREASQAEKRHQEATQAVLDLRELAPMHVQDCYRDAVADFQASVQQPLFRAKDDLNVLTLALGREWEIGSPKHLDHLKTHFPAAVTMKLDLHMQRYSLSPEWPRIKEELEGKKPELEAEIERLQQAFDAGTEDCNRLLDYYVG